MNVVLTAEEILKVYEVLLKSSKTDELLVSKFRQPIQDMLEKEQARTNEEKFEAWSSLEEKKINNLVQKNENIKVHKRRSA